jgi:hypothetical protein
VYRETDSVKPGYEYSPDGFEKHAPFHDLVACQSNTAATFSTKG